MTSKEQRKLQKRKAREKETRQQTLARREEMRAPIREARDEYRREKRIRKIQKEMEQFDQIMGERELSVVNDDVLSQLEKNIEILKALEAEHNREVSQRALLNNDLEEKGYFTLEEKMKAAQEMFADKEEFGVGGSAEYKVEGTSKETAQVSVIKAPQPE